MSERTEYLQEAIGKRLERRSRFIRFNDKVATNLGLLSIEREHSWTDIDIGRISVPLTASRKSREHWLTDFIHDRHDQRQIWLPKISAEANKGFHTDIGSTDAPTVLAGWQNFQAELTQWQPAPTDEWGLRSLRLLIDARLLLQSIGALPEDSNLHLYK